MFSRKYQHEFKIHVNQDSHEGAVGLSIDLVDQFLVANEGKLCSYSEKEYTIMQEEIADFRSITN